MWVLIFVVAVGSRAVAPVTSFTQEFSSYETCMSAAKQLSLQSQRGNNTVYNNVCVKK